LLNTYEMALEAFHWGKLDKAIHPPPPQPSMPGVWLLCPNFLKGDMEEAAYEFGIPELVQATFYDMTVSYTEELGEFLMVVGQVIEQALGDLQWFSFEG